MSWTEDRVEILTKMWTEGHSAAEIAKALGGITRNAVIGKAHRLGLSGRASPIKKKATTTTKKKTTKTATKKTSSKTATKKTSASKETKKVAKDTKQNKLGAKEKQRIIKQAIEEAAAESSGDNAGTGISFLELTEKRCKWPIGDPQSPDFYFCGKPSPQGIPYCQEHIEMAYQMPKKAGDRNKRAAMKVVADTTEVVDVEVVVDDVEDLVSDDDDTIITDTVEAK